MGMLWNIVSALKKESSGTQGKLLIARVGLKAGINLAQVTEKTEDNPVLAERILKSAKEVLGKELMLIQAKLDDIEKLEQTASLANKEQ